MIAYFDESGSHEGTTVFVLACVVGREATWDAFQQRWHRLLAHEGVPEIHMADLEARHEHFKTWSAPRYRAVRDTMGAILTGSLRLHFFFNAFFMADYDDVIIRPPRGRRHYYVKTPYTLSMQVLLEMMWDTLHPTLKPKERITCVFDRNDQVCGEATRIFDELLAKKAGWRDVYSGPIFGSRAVAVPLQAADVLVYENRLAMKEMRASARRRKPRPLMRRFIATRRIYGTYFERDEIRRMSKVMMQAAARRAAADEVRTGRPSNAARARPSGRSDPDA